MENLFIITRTAAVHHIVDTHARIFQMLERVYTAMDDAYRSTAEVYGFHCNGCEDNCCLTRFYHHTVVEYIYLLNGFLGLETERRHGIYRSAAEVNREMAEAEKKGEPVRRMCPLNAGGRCLLYAQRPMICRLHGLAHEMRHPAKGTVYGPGCEAFTKQCRHEGYHPFDRTPFYRKLAGVESDLKQAAGIGQKFKMTVAQMVTSLEDGGPLSDQSESAS